MADMIDGKKILLVTQIRGGKKNAGEKLLLFFFNFGFLKCGDSVIQQIK
jgi:hypothetical protein